MWNKAAIVDRIGQAALAGPSVNDPNELFKLLLFQTLNPSRGVEEIPKRVLSNN